MSVRRFIRSNGPGLALGLFLGRLFSEAFAFFGPGSVNIWMGAALTAVSLPVGLLLTRRCPVGKRWPFWLLLGYLLYPYPDWRAALAGYDTAKPWENFLAQWALSHLIVILLAGVGAFLVFLATDVFLQEAVGFRALPEPSVPRTLGVAAALWGVFRVLEFAGQLIPGDRFSLPLWSLPGADSYLPGFAAVSHGIFFLIVGFLPAVIAVAAAWRYLRNRTGCGILAATVALVALSRSANFWQWSFHVVELVVLAGVLILLIRTCGVDLAGFAVAVFWLQAGAGSVALIEQPAAMLKWNGIVALLVAVIAGLLVLLRWKPRASFPGGNQSPVAGDVGTEDGPGSVSV